MEIKCTIHRKGLLGEDKKKNKPEASLQNGWSESAPVAGQDKSSDFIKDKKHTGCTGSGVDPNTKTPGGHLNTWGSDLYRLAPKTESLHAP